MDFFKIAVVLAALCGVAYEEAYAFATGRHITQHLKARKPLSTFTRWRTCTEKGFHPTSGASTLVPSVSVHLVPAGTQNTSWSVSCFEPGESYDVIISSSKNIHGILIMPLKVGLRKYRDDLVSVGTMRNTRLNRDLFMDSICSDQSVSHKSSFKNKRLTVLIVPWDAPNNTCSVEFIYHVVFTYGIWKLNRTVVYPVCNETRNETRNETTTETMESTDSEIYSGTESVTEPESGDLNGTISPTSSSSTPITTDTKPAPLPTTKVPTNMDQKDNSQ